MATSTWTFGQTQFVGNSNLSGDMQITDLRTGQTVSVEGSALAKLVADAVRVSRIAHLENAGAGELLGLNKADARRIDGPATPVRPLATPFQTGTEP